jgi:hypothetical protein
MVVQVAQQGALVAPQIAHGLERQQHILAVEVEARVQAQAQAQAQV